MGFMDRWSNIVGSKKGSGGEIDSELSQIYQINLLDYKGKTLERYCARIATAAAEKKDVNNEAIAVLTKNYKNGKDAYVDVTLPTFTMHERFAWGLNYYHRTKTGENPISWRMWYELPKVQRDEYYADLWYGVRAKREQDDDPLIFGFNELTPEDVQFIEPFLDTFWELAQTCLGVKFDDTKTECTLREPTVNVDEIICNLGVEGTDFFIKISAKLPLDGYVKMSEEDRTAFMKAYRIISSFITEKEKAYSEYELGDEGVPQTGSKITDFDLLCMAADQVGAMPGIKPGYVDSVKKMVRNQEKKNRTIDAVLTNMRGASDKYAAVLKAYEELKKNPPKTGDSEQSTTPAPAPGPTTPAPAPAPTQPAPTAPVQVVDSTLRGMYEQQEREYGAYARSKKPTDWDGIVAAIPEIAASFAEARKNELADLPYMNMTAFRIAMLYIDKTGGNMLSCITKLCDIELAAAAAAKKQAASA